MYKVKTLYFLIIIGIMFVSMFANIEHVFADRDSIPHHNVTTTDYGGNGIMVNPNQTMSPFLPSPPLGMYPYTSKIFSVFQIDPEIVHPTDTSSIHILVTNNANFTLYDVNLGESVNDSKSMLFSNIHKIDILNPNQTKTIYGTLYVSDSVQPTDYYDIWWNIVAKNQTGNMMESMQFHRNLPIEQNLSHYYSGPVVITLESPLQQFKSGIAAKDVKCNDDLQLIFKTEGNFPACVKITTAFHLSVQGWGYLPSPFMIKADLLNSIISGGKIKELQYDIQSRSIIIKIQTASDGSLMVTIPQFMTDLNPSDKPFKDFHTILADGMEENIGLVPTANGSSFTIPFVNGTQEIEIIGNQVGMQG